MKINVRNTVFSRNDVDEKINKKTENKTNNLLALCCSSVMVFVQSQPNNKVLFKKQKTKLINFLLRFKAKNIFEQIGNICTIPEYSFFNCFICAQHILY